MQKLCVLGVANEKLLSFVVLFLKRLIFDCLCTRKYFSYYYRIDFSVVQLFDETRHRLTSQRFNHVSRGLFEHYRYGFSKILKFCGQPNLSPIFYPSACFLILLSVDHHTIIPKVGVFLAFFEFHVCSWAILMTFESWLVMQNHISKLSVQLS